MPTRSGERGLSGVANRLAAFDGTLSVVSPHGRTDGRESGDSLRAVIAEDLALLRDGLVRVLTAHGIDVVEAVQDGPSVVRALLAHRPDIAVLDVRLPPTFTNEGLVAAVEARRQLPDLPILVLSQYVEPLYARELLSSRAGGVGYLLKDRVMDVGQFVEAVRRVASGGTVMDPEVVSQLVIGRERDDTMRRLTPREREVLALMAEGRSNAAIAAALVVSEKAVSKHIANIFLKLGSASLRRRQPSRHGRARLLERLNEDGSWRHQIQGPRVPRQVDPVPFRPRCGQQMG